MNSRDTFLANRMRGLGGSDIAAVLGSEKYAVSRRGEVLSFISKKVLAQSITHRGYAMVKLGKDNWKLIHRLVAEAFIPNPENKPQVNHKDGNPLNNHADNLEWCTQSENQHHAYRTGLQQPPMWSDESREKLSRSQRGHAVSEETRRRISEARKGKGCQPKTEEHKRKISESLRNGRAA